MDLIDAWAADQQRAEKNQLSADIMREAGANILVDQWRAEKNQLAPDLMREGAAHILVVDTSTFTDLSVSKFRSPKEALISFLKLVKQTQGKVQVLITPGVYNELFVFKGPQGQTFINPDEVPDDLLILLEQQSPKMHELQLPASFMFSYIQETHQRVNAYEKSLVDRFRELLGMDKSKKGRRRQQKAQETLAETSIAKKMEVGGMEIRNTRDSHRQHLRHGMIDSPVDFSTLLLAYQAGALLVSTDEGIIKWGTELGCRLLTQRLLYTWVLNKK